MQYRSEIDGLRAVAVLPVILYHAGFDFFSGGYVGVDVFFVISGYLITTIILSEKEAGRFTITNFYERRARRILPALFFVIVSCVPFAWYWMTPSELRDFSQSIVAVSLFSSNILFWLTSGYFGTAAELKPLLHTWSLSVEEQYYVIFPLFVLIAWRFGKRVMVIALVFVCLISISSAQWSSTHYPDAAFYLLPSRLWELLIGSLCAFYLLYPERTGLQKLTVPFAVRQVVSACGLLLIVYSIVTYDSRTPYPSLYTLLPTIGTALIILFTFENDFIRKFLSNRIFVGIGLVSYSAYLWHYPLFAFARIRSFEKPDGVLMIALAMLTMALSYLTWRFIERPFRNKQKFNRKFIFQTALVSSVVLFMSGFTGYYRGGEMGRFSSDQLSTLSNLRQLRKERQSLIRPDVCQFNDTSGRGLDYFLENWDCRDDGNSSGLKKIPLIVAGDSHSADIVVALKLNGYLPLQIGGAGCSLDPDFMSLQCSQIFAKLFDEVKDDPYFEYIVLANRYEEDELSMHSLRRSIDFWEKFGLKIIMFTGMPEFYNFEKAVIFSLTVMPDVKVAKYSERKEAADYLSSRGVHVIDREAIFCSITSNCSYRDSDGELLIVDYGHLSRAGAERFGKALLDSDSVMRSIVDTGGG